MSAVMTPTLPRDPALVATLLDTAVHLRAAGRAGSPPQPLRGKNVALLTPSADLPSARALAQAAHALGAQVVHVLLGSLPPSGSPALPDTLALLGRLYDGVVTDGVPPELVRQVIQQVDRPVLDHAMDKARSLATEELEIDVLLQAMLLQALA